MYGIPHSIIGLVSPTHVMVSPVTRAVVVVVTLHESLLVPACSHAPMPMLLL